MGPDEFREFECLRIDAGAVVGENKKEMVLRVLPNVTLLFDLLMLFVIF